MKYSENKIPPGSIIHSEKPFVYCLSSKVKNEHCDFCFRNGTLLKCTGCYYVYYCDKVCQKEAWSVHKAECKRLKNVAPRILPDAARMLARLIRILGKNGNQIRSYYTEINFRMYKDLMSHYTNLKNDSKRLEHFQSLSVVLNEFLHGEFIPNEVDLMGMFGRMCINSFNICNEEQQNLGTGMYLGASILDHSCDPNAVAMFKGTTLVIRTLKSLSHLNWSEIFISYIDVLNTTEIRREELERIYYFTCRCMKCVTPDPIEMQAAACPNEDCDNAIYVNTEKCSSCGSEITETFQERFNEVNELTDLHLQNMRDRAYLDACKICLEKQKGVLHKFNIKYIKILDNAFESSIEFGKFEDALSIGLQLVEPFNKYYGKFHPLCGLLHLKLGKILIYLNKDEEGRKQLRHAYEILKITHGVDSNIFREQLIPALKCGSS